MSKVYYDENREKILTKKKAYYEQHREEILQKRREYRKKNRAKILERKRKYNAAHAAERNEKQKVYYWEHLEERTAYNRQYYEEHGDEVRQATARNSKKSIAELEALLRKIFTMKCFFCGRIDKQPRLGISFHKKDGKEHDYHTIPKLRYILKHPDEFVVVCRHHHILSHRLMIECFTWEEIVKLIVEKRKEVGPEKLTQIWEEYLKRHRKKKEGVV